MSGVVGVFAMGGSRVPCETQITEMAKYFASSVDHQFSFGDHRLRLECMLNPGLGQSTFQCPDTGSFVWLSGEFKNAATLLTRMGSDGAHSHNAAELLLRLYEMKGLLCVPQLRGAFAAVIWDAVANRLVLIRDQLGLGSLFFYRDGDNVWFASSEQALRLLEPVALNLSALHAMVMTGVPDLGETLIRKVESVRPGEFVLADRGRIRRTRYWQFLYEAPTPPDLSKLQQILGQSVDQSLHLRGNTQFELGQCSADTGLLAALYQQQSRLPIQATTPLTTINPVQFKALVQQWQRPFGSVDDYVWALRAKGIQPQSKRVLPVGEDLLFGLHAAYSRYRWKLRTQTPEQQEFMEDPLWALRPLFNDFVKTKQYLAPEFLAALEQEPLTFTERLPKEWVSLNGTQQLQAGLVHFQLHSLVASLNSFAHGQAGQFDMPYVNCELLEYLAEVDPRLHTKGVVGGQLLAQGFAAFMTEVSSDYVHRLTRPPTELASWVDFTSLWQTCSLLLTAAEPVQSAPFAWLKVRQLCQALSQPESLTAADQRAALFLASFSVWLADLDLYL